MKYVIYWLEERRLLTFILVIAYSVFIIPMHDPMVKLSVWIMNELNPQRYDKVVAIVSALVLAVVLVFFAKGLLRDPRARFLKTVYFIAFTAIIVLHMHYLLVLNIEVIHAFQYALLAFLIFPLTRNFWQAIYFTIIIGAVDEWYQYQLLYPETTDYFDFNDMVMNQLGASLSMIFLAALGVRPKNLFCGKWFSSAAVISFLLISFALILLFQFELITLYPNEGAWFHFFTASDPYPFWRNPEGTHIYYHVFTPAEGLAIILFLIALMMLFDYRLLKKE